MTRLWRYWPRDGLRVLGLTLLALNTLPVALTLVSGACPLRDRGAVSGFEARQ